MNVRIGQEGISSQSRRLVRHPAIPSIPCRSYRSMTAIPRSDARITLEAPGLAWQFVYGLPAAAAKQTPPPPMK